MPPLFDGFAGKTVTTEMLQSALHHGTEWRSVVSLVLFKKLLSKNSASKHFEKLFGEHARLKLLSRPGTPTKLNLMT